MLQKFLSLANKRCLNGYKSQVIPSKFDNIIIAMSSGVDSSVAGALFAGSYPNARGIFMQNWSKDEASLDDGKEACFEKDWKDVVKVGSHLNLPVDYINFEKDYWIDVFEPMLDVYKRGMTPNPDINCNRHVKFGKLVDHLNSKYGENNYWLVTGHYARCLKSTEDSQTHLLKSYYKNKDQSYYLSQIKNGILSNLILPMGHMTKPEVRELAIEAELPTAEKADSQGICFVNNSQHGKFKNFLQSYLPESKGNIITIDPVSSEKIIWGQHQGLWSYTIGQKIGLSMPQGDPRYKGTWFVSEKRNDTNEIVIVKGRDHPSLFQRQLQVKDFIPIGISKEQLINLCNSSTNSNELKIQYRSLQDPIDVESIKINPNEDSSMITITLKESQRAMVPGQYCCMYINDRVLGSGIISKTRI
ncbi:hypothetical protein Kpol_479p27 [Vanderwaltozyma polyspora DSM 70294]|uniref:tRNA-5-taurinomethyluridine 2-sulfurtransferase n=1 Tax=Vanderwaltozyma polyspora (strain ATCC 22028 / DSM 70294 / BCRC 21397 / CBS 2163 / NBRC 10782 / NRRL Y-8283 / UCD 57-17) TaxID=436907 RepID=A7TQE0_VANPO|nr:uncharacterized protein Kpol_479p27 [Vanderwaltozyma polyspora DSM 70294]EDO15539.1 hypothetical protein Kpol_479p27 [Vanderwaltozyma polyspora DSM 70294]